MAVLSERQAAAVNCRCICHKHRDAGAEMVVEDHAVNCRWACLLIDGARRS